MCVIRHVSRRVTFEKSETRLRHQSEMDFALDKFGMTSRRRDCHSTDAASLSHTY